MNPFEESEISVCRGGGDPSRPEMIDFHSRCAGARMDATYSKLYILSVMVSATVAKTGRSYLQARLQDSKLYILSFEKKKNKKKKREGEIRREKKKKRRRRNRKKRRRRRRRRKRGGGGGGRRQRRRHDVTTTT